MSRRDDRDRSRTRRRRDRSPSPQPRKARRREHNDNQVSEGMDWNNLVSWQHNSGYNTSNAIRYHFLALSLRGLCQRVPTGDAPTFAALAALWGLEPGYITKLTDKALCHLIVTARLLTG